MGRHYNRREGSVRPALVTKGTTCWICHRPLECRTEGGAGLGRVIWECPVCRREIEDLQRQVKQLTVALARATRAATAATTAGAPRPRARADWVLGRRLYEEEELHKAEIARRLGVTPQAVDYHEKRDGWIRNGKDR